MRYTLGRFLQLLGMATLLLGLYVGVSLNNVRGELIYMALGVAIFYGGKLLQGKSE